MILLTHAGPRGGRSAACPGGWRNSSGNPSLVYCAPNRPIRCNMQSVVGLRLASGNGFTDCKGYFEGQLMTRKDYSNAMVRPPAIRTCLPMVTHAIGRRDELTCSVAQRRTNVGYFAWSFDERISNLTVAGCISHSRQAVTSSGMRRPTFGKYRRRDQGTIRGPVYGKW